MGKSFRHRVKGASGATLEVMHVKEKKWFEENLKEYLDQYRFENIADLQDLDRLLGLELLSYRFGSWMVQGAGVDYDGLVYDEKAVREHKTKLDQEIRLIKKHMGMDRKGRTESEQESVATFLTNLLRRGEEFGVHRDTQIAAAMDLFNDLKTLVGLYQRTDEEERRHLGVELDQIFQWVVEEAIPRYDAIDAAFRQNQRLWKQEVS